MKDIIVLFILLISSSANAGEWKYTYTSSTPLEINNLSMLEACNSSVNSAVRDCLIVCEIEEQAECTYGIGMPNVGELGSGMQKGTLDAVMDDGSTAKVPVLLSPKTESSLNSKMCSATAYCKAK